MLDICGTSASRRDRGGTRCTHSGIVGPCTHWDWETNGCSIWEKNWSPYVSPGARGQKPQSDLSSDPQDFQPFSVASLKLTCVWQSFFYKVSQKKAPFRNLGGPLRPFWTVWKIMDRSGSFWIIRTQISPCSSKTVQNGRNSPLKF